jgi:hypothetical protein
MDNWYEIYTFLSVMQGPTEYKKVSPFLKLLVKLDLCKDKGNDMWDSMEDLFA